MNLISGAQIARSLGGGRSRKIQEDSMKNVFKWADLYLEANDPAEKKLILDLGMSFIETLPQGIRESLRPTIEAGPFGAENMKRERFKLKHPEPQVTADVKTSPYLYASQIFQHKEWEASMNKVVSGKDTFIPSIVGISEDLYATRDEKGVVNLYSTKEFEEKGKAEKLGKPLSEFIAGGGYAKTDKTQTFTNPWGSSTKERAYIDLSGKETWVAETIDRTVRETEEDKRLRSFYTNFLNLNTDDALVAAVEIAMEAEKPIEQIIEEIIAPAFPNYYFFPKGKYRDLLGRGVDIGDQKLQFIKGTEVLGEYKEKPAKFIWSFDQKSGRIFLYNKAGAVIKDPGAIKKAVEQYKIPIPPDFIGRF